MIRLLAAYGGVAVVFLALDSVWLTVAGGKLYKPLLGDLLAPQFRLAPAVIFYLIYVGGVTALAVLPGLKEASMSKTAVTGAILGFVAYATYDLTNQATLRTWSTTITLADIAWGTFVTTVAAVAGYFAARAVSS